MATRCRWAAVTSRPTCITRTSSSSSSSSSTYPPQSQSPLPLTVILFQYSPTSESLLKQHKQAKADTSSGNSSVTEITTPLPSEPLPCLALPCNFPFHPPAFRIQYPNHHRCHTVTRLDYRTGPEMRVCAFCAWWVADDVV